MMVREDCRNEWARAGGAYSVGMFVQSVITSYARVIHFDATQRSRREPMKLSHQTVGLSEYLKVKWQF